jgi:hypothetical protein
MMAKKHENYTERITLWREELLISKALHQESLESSNRSIRLMQQENLLHKKQIERIDEEIRFADQELKK